MKEMTLEVRNLSKKYKKNLAVKDVSFTLQPESIYGLLGRNGAGKWSDPKKLDFFWDD